MAGTKGDGGRSGDAYPLRLFLSLRADLTRYVRTIAADGDDVDDIVQEAWCRFSAAAPSQAIQEPRGFLFRIARNLAMDGHRRRQTERKLFASEAPEVTSLVPSDEPSAQAQVEAVDELAAVRAAIARLPERTRTAFLLHRVEGLKLVDIAARMGISKSLAQQLVVDGLERCKAARRRAGQPQ
jgi:RNA polymerase sigma factor (sigma-70 family)